MFLARPPRIIRTLAPRRVWHVPGCGNRVFLTFDDGPTPETTPMVLDLLKTEGVKATFFCLGAAALQRPELLLRIRNEGHALGNHSWSHLNGWKTETAKYVSDVQRCAEVVSSPLFRPPYGSITFRQAKALAGMGYRIVMWSSLSGDYDPRKRPQECAQNVLKGLKPGDIMVFHDSAKSRNNVMGALPEVIRGVRERGYQFDTLTQRTT